jgi:hypothetical protein
MLREQRRFVKELVKGVQEHILQLDIPPEWDGKELRYLIADQFVRVVLETKKYDNRRREYKNYCLVNNI